MWKIRIPSIILGVFTCLVGEFFLFSTEEYQESRVYKRRRWKENYKNHLRTITIQWHVKEATRMDDLNISSIVTEIATFLTNFFLFFFVLLRIIFLLFFEDHFFLQKLFCFRLLLFLKEFIFSPWPLLIVFHSLFFSCLSFISCYIIHSLAIATRE